MRQVIKIYLDYFTNLSALQHVDICEETWKCEVKATLSYSMNDAKD